MANMLRKPSSINFKLDCGPIIHQTMVIFMPERLLLNHLPGWSALNDHAGSTLRAERDISTPVCLVRLYCLPLWETETAKFLVVRELRSFAL